VGSDADGERVGAEVEYHGYLGIHPLDDAALAPEVPVLARGVGRKESLAPTQAKRS